MANWHQWSWSFLWLQCCYCTVSQSGQRGNVFNWTVTQRLSTPCTSRPVWQMCSTSHAELRCARKRTETTHSPSTSTSAHWWFRTTTSSYRWGRVRFCGQQSRRTNCIKFVLNTKLALFNVTLKKWGQQNRNCYSMLKKWFVLRLRCGFIFLGDISIALLVIFLLH